MIITLRARVAIHDTIYNANIFHELWDPVSWRSSRWADIWDEKFVLEGGEQNLNEGTSAFSEVVPDFYEM